MGARRTKAWMENTLRDIKLRWKSEREHHHQCVNDDECVKIWYFQHFSWISLHLIPFTIWNASSFVNVLSHEGEESKASLYFLHLDLCVHSSLFIISCLFTICLPSWISFYFSPSFISCLLGKIERNNTWKRVRFLLTWLCESTCVGCKHDFFFSPDNVENNRKWRGPYTLVSLLIFSRGFSLPHFFSSQVCTLIIVVVILISQERWCILTVVVVARFINWCNF